MKEPMNVPVGTEKLLLLKADEVARLVAISTRTLWRLVNTGEFPRPLQFGRNTRWRIKDIEEWVNRTRSRPAAIARSDEMLKGEG